MGETLRLPLLLLCCHSNVVGVVTMTNMTSKMLNGSVKAADEVSHVLYKQFEMVGVVSSIHVAKGLINCSWMSQ